MHASLSSSLYRVISLELCSRFAFYSIRLALALFQSLFNPFDDPL